MYLALIRAFWGFALTIVSNIIYRVLASVAVGFVTYTGIDLTIGFLKTEALSKLHALPAEVYSLLSYMGVGTALSIYFSALVARMVLLGMSSGAVRHFSFQPGGSGSPGKFPSLPGA